MKHTKKLLLAVLCVALVLASTLLVVAACGPKTYTVTLEQYDKTQGTVQYTLPAEGEAYTEKENVTVTVTPAEGYEVGSVKVNGTEVQLENGAYSFKIAQDTTISVTFRKLLNVTVTVNIPEGITNSDSWLSAPANGTKYADGETVTLTLVPHADYEIESVKIGTQTLTAADGKYTFQATTDPTEVQVTVKKVKFSVTVSSTPEAGGTALLSQPEAGAGQKYALNEEVTLTVAANENYTVKSITINGVAQQDVSQETYTITVTEDTTIEVEFAPTYAVNVHRNPEAGGTATLEPQQARYNEGAEVTLTVSAAANYVLDYVQVNGRTVAPDTEEGNTYTFNVTRDTDIDVNFITYTASVLRSVQGSARFEGTVTWGGYSTDVLAIFDETPGSQSLLLEQSDSGYYSYVLAGVKQSGKLYAVMHDPEHAGRAQYLPVTAADKQPIDYNTYNNPFASLVEANLTSAGDGLWTVSNDIAANIILRLARNAVTVSSVQLHEEDGKIVSINITATIQVSVSGQPQSISYTAEFEVSEHGTAAVPENMIGNAPTDSNFKNALTKAAAADSYSLTAEFLGQTIKLVYADNAFYRISENGGSGYYERVDGSVWSFTYNDVDKQFVKGEQVLASGGIAAINAVFDIQDEDGDYYSLFYNAGNGAYKIYANDQFALTQDTGIVGYLAYYFFDVQPLGFSSYLPNALDITITLGQDGALTVEIPCYISYNGAGYAVPLSLSFSAFGTTELPFEIPQSEIDGSVDPAYVGSWVCDDNGLLVEVGLDDIAVDGTTASSVTANPDGSLRVVCGDEEYTLTFAGDGATIVGMDKVEHKLRKMLCAWENFVGVYEGDDGEYTVYLEITVDGSVVITIGDGSANKLEISDFEWHNEDGTDVLEMLWNYVDDEQTIPIYVDLTLVEKNAIIEFFMYYEQEDKLYYIFLLNLYADDYEGVHDNDPTPYYGTYTGETSSQNTLQINEEGITLKLDGQNINVAWKDVTYNDNPIYPVRIFSFTVSGTKYTLQQYGYSYDYLVLFVNSVNTEAFVRGELTPVPRDDVIGTYTGEGESKVHDYDVEITADGFVFKIDGVAQKVENLTFDRYLFTLMSGESAWLYEFDFSVGTDKYILRQGDDYCYVLVLLKNGDLEDYLDRYESLDDWSALAGIYTCDDYTVVITAEGVTVTPKNGEASEASEVEFDKYYDYDTGEGYYQLSFVWNGEVGVIQPNDGTNCVTFVIIGVAGNERYTLVKGDYTLDYDLTEMVGYWTGEGVVAGNTKYALKVTAEGIWLSVGGGELQQLTIVYYSKTLGYICELDGARWQVIYIWETDDTAQTFSENIFLFGDNDRVMLSRSKEPGACEWKEYIGTWSGKNTVGDTSVTYTVVIDETSLHITSSDGTWNFTVDNNTESFRYSNGLQWSWRYDDKVWCLMVQGQQLDLYYDDYTEVDAYLDKQGSAATNALVGTWTGTWSQTPGGNYDNKPVTIEFKADGTFTVTVSSGLEYTGHYTYDAASGAITITDMDVGGYDFSEATFTLNGGGQLSIRITIEQDYEPYYYEASGLTKQA